LDPRYQKFETVIEKIAEGADIWKHTDLGDARNDVLMTFAAQPSTTHHVERGVELGNFVKSLLLLYPLSASSS
jgi:hypothetical protein